jgi:hypothetical protein
MLSTLLGSKSAERVLLFLLVNECCYANEIQKIYATPLTPLQSILSKLEKAAVISIEQRGKTKLYRFNPGYPLLDELKALLKKAFILLPHEEKRILFARKEERQLTIKASYAKEKQKALFLTSFWDRLSKIKRVSIQTHSGLQGFGEVSVEKAQQTLIFTEKGQWTAEAQELGFSNVLRWTIDHSAQMIALEHLRHGPARPVFLFHLAPIGPKTLQSIDSHLCRDDCYFGRIEVSDRHIRFLWRILGPRKNEILHHTYE